MSRIFGLSAALFGVCLSVSTAAGFPVVSGSKANDVVGQANYTTGFVDFAADPFSESITATRVSRRRASSVASTRDVQVFPDPDIPISATRNLAAYFVALENFMRILRRC